MNVGVASQSYSGLLSPGRSNSTYFLMVNLVEQVMIFLGISNWYQVQSSVVVKN